MQVRVIGDKTGLDEKLVTRINELEETTRNATGLKFTIGINYGGRDELKIAFVKLAKRVENGELKPEAITEAMIHDNLDTAGLPDPELLIRTSGEERLSNFLPWQLAYTEFYFTDVLWPDFTKEDLLRAIRYYNGRERRFGGVK